MTSSGAPSTAAAAAVVTATATLTMDEPSHLTVIFFAPMLTGGISTIASVTIIVSILRSNVKLTTVYRRLIFGISSFDAIQSLAQTLSFIPMPSDVNMWGAVGNYGTCEAQGFLFVMGLCGAGFYSLSLTVYFLLITKFELNETKIKARIERYLHAFTILYTLIISITVYATKHLNPSKAQCWIESRPFNCNRYNDPDSDLKDCESYGNTNVIQVFATGIPIILAGILDIIIFIIIWWTLRSRRVLRSARRNSAGSAASRPFTSTISLNSDGHLPPSARGGNTQTADTTQSRWWCCTKYSQICRRCSTAETTSSSNNAIPSSTLLADRLSREPRASTNAIQIASRRTILYFVVFLLVTIFPIVLKQSSHVVIIFFARFLFPLRGFLNIVMYSYPHVMMYKRMHPNTSYFRAFVQVIKSGGDSDNHQSSLTGIGRAARRRQSISKRRKVLEQCENNTSPPRAYGHSALLVEQNQPLAEQVVEEGLVGVVPLSFHTTCVDNYEQFLLTMDEDDEENDDIGNNLTTIMERGKCHKFTSSDDDDDDDDDDNNNDNDMATIAKLYGKRHKNTSSTQLDITDNISINNN